MLLPPSWFFIQKITVEGPSEVKHMSFSHEKRIGSENNFQIKNVSNPGLGFWSMGLQFEI